MNWVQRVIAFVAALILLLVAFSEGVAGDYDSNPWVALVSFLLAIGLLFLTFKSSQEF